MLSTQTIFMEILDMTVSRRPIKELSRQYEDHDLKAVRSGMTRSCDDQAEAQTPGPGGSPVDNAADRCPASPLQRQHQSTKRLRLSDEVKRRLLELSVGSFLPGPVSPTCFSFVRMIP